jgi:glycosyltransferase involved in cell wall biosynthesis
MLQVAAEPEVQVKVIAPVPLIDYSNPRGNLFQSFSIPRLRYDGPMEIWHPRWLFPPFGTPWNILFQFTRLLWPVVRLRSRYRFDLIDSHFGYPDGVVSALLGLVLRRPFVVTLRGNELVFGRMRIRRAALRWAFRRALRIITVSEELRQFAISLGIDPERIVTIPNGVDGSVFYPRDREPCRARFGIENGRKVIVSAGGLGKGKGHHLIVQALPALIEAGLDVEFLLAGSPNRDGRFEAEIQSLIRQLDLKDRVRLLGRVQSDDLAELMNAADVFCLASFSEGWPNVVHEALASGTPVVVTRVGGIPEMVRSPECGILVPPGDAAALGKALGEAMKQSWDREAIALWGQSRNWKNVAQEVVQVMRSALERLE